MRRFRFLCAVALGGTITAALGFAASILALANLIPLAQKTPDWWGKLILTLCYRGCMGKEYVQNPSFIPPPFDGFTLIVANHPQLEYSPGIIGVIARLGLSAAIVSKVENLEGWVGLIAGRPLKRTGRGAFISQRGGKMSRELLREAVKTCDSILIFADKHRPTPQALKNDRQDYPDVPLTRTCVPRPGGVHSILEATIAEGRPVRVIDITWHPTDTAIHAKWKDVTGKFVTLNAREQVLMPEEAMRENLIGLWKDKEMFMAAHP